MRRAAVALVVAVPAALLTIVAADAGAGAARQGPPPPPGGGPVTVQVADVARKASPAASTTSHRGTRLRADDAATPRSPGTAPAMSASSPLTAAQDGPGHAVAASCGARAPPETA